MLFFVSHKGNGDHGYRANSKEAILTMLQVPGIYGVEFDVRLTKDQQLVVIHDPIIDFVSDGTGIVKYMTLHELRKYNFGTKNNPGRIATVEEILKEAPTDKKILIEVKSIEKDFRVMDALYVLLQRYSMLSVMVISFQVELLNYIKKKDSHIVCGLLVGYFLNHDHDDTMDCYLYQEAYIEKLPYGLQYYFWTVNQLDTVQKIQKRYSNAYIITDCADYFLMSSSPLIK